MTATHSSTEVHSISRPERQYNFDILESVRLETMEQPKPPHHSTGENLQQAQQPSSFDNSTSPEHGESGSNGLPSESQLVLLCLDYLRDLRRAYPAGDLEQLEGLNADYLSIAVFALSRCFSRPASLVGSNDCMMDPMKQPPLPAHKIHQDSQNTVNPHIPSMTEINHEILYVQNPQKDEEDENGAEKKNDYDHSDPYSWYDYDDMHDSNVHRFYPLSGLASGPSLKGSLTLGEITAAGLAGLGARSRLEAEKDMIQSPLFEQFVQAVKSKGFFMDPDNDTPLPDPEEERLRVMRQMQNYEERYRKVVAKFRTKLAAKAESPSKNGAVNSANASNSLRAANWLALTSAERQRCRREEAMDEAWRKNQDGTPQSSGQTVPGIGMSPRVVNISSEQRDGSTPTNHHNYDPLTPRSQAEHPKDFEQAERAKAEGNVFMQKKLYPQAVQSYTHALKISPNGPHSHVYFSNRAAALLSMKKFADAILDSERSLALKPDYGKAHARLGLAHFLSGNYRLAMEAYTVSLKYEPNNASSKSYLEKAAKRLAESGSSNQQQGTLQSSFSLVSEWESSQRNQNHHYHQQQQQLPQQVDIPTDGPTNQRGAEKFKAKGNAFMAQREYDNALEAYTQAIQCSPNGLQSHVYYSNRAAALCYLERYHDAVSDSQRSLELKPDYGKAHARLGLSRYFLQDYAGAVAAYTAALQQDPENAASKSYLAKAKAKLEGRNSRPGSRSASPSLSSSRNPSPSPLHRSHSRQPSLS